MFHVLAQTFAHLGPDLVRFSSMPHLRASSLRCPVPVRRGICGPLWRSCSFLSNFVFLSNDHVNSRVFAQVHSALILPVHCQLCKFPTQHISLRSSRTAGGVMERRSSNVIVAWFIFRPATSPSTTTAIKAPPVFPCMLRLPRPVAKTCRLWLPLVETTPPNPARLGSPVEAPLMNF
jgi:hypothetical protein